jgi:hypothetical protein
MSQNHTSKTRELDAPERPGLDRRTFLGTVGLTAGAAIAAAVLPLTARADDRDSALAMGARPVAGEAVEELWDVDAMWGQRPRYAHPIPYAHGIPGAGPLESSGPYSVIAREP